MTVTPDLQGFRDAQRRRRAAFGEDVVFLGAFTMSFPAGTNLDPETGQPYDPVVEATSAAQTSATIPCEVAFDPTRGDEVEPIAVGYVERTEVLLICDHEYASAASGAVSVSVRDELYKVVAMKPDGLTGGTDRLLTWARRR